MEKTGFDKTKYQCDYMKKHREGEREQRKDYLLVKPWFAALFEIFDKRAECFVDAAKRAGIPFTTADLSILDAIQEYKDAGKMPVIGPRKIYKKEGGST